MSLFNRILSLPDVISRIQQFDSQLSKLEKEEPRLTSTGRASFNRRSQDLKKQLDEYLRKVENIPMRNYEQEERKKDAISTLIEYKTRAVKIGGEPRVSRQSSIMESNPPPRPDAIQPTSDAKLAPTAAERRTAPLRQRAASIMYDADDASSESEDDESKSGRSERSEQAAAAMRDIRIARETVRDNDTRQREEVQPVTRERERTPQEQGETPAATSIQEEENPPTNTTTPNTNVLGGQTVEGNKFVVLADFKGEERTDLSIKKGDVLTIIHTRSDGWWTAANTLGFTGLVPKTFLRHWDPNEGTRAEHIERPAADRARVPEPSTDQQSAVQRQPSPLNEAIRQRMIPSVVAHLEPTTSQQQQPSRYSETPTGLGDALRRDCHLTYACHLTPRLSESNLAFHDLYWNFNDDKLRKRNIRVSKIVRLVRLEGMPRSTVEGALVRTALLDLSRKTGRQIVSNVHTLRAQIKNGTWTFLSKISDDQDSIEFCDFLVRSNYRQSQVVLLLEASTVVVKLDGSIEERTLGVMKIPLVNENGTCTLVNKTYADFLLDENAFDRRQSQPMKTSHKLIMKVMDVDHEILGYVDSLPDVLLFNPMFAVHAFYFRRRCGAILIRDRQNGQSAELISDPLIATFPRVADQPDILDYCRRAFHHKRKMIVKKPEAEQVQAFYNFYMETAFVLLDTAILPDYSPWDKRSIAVRRTMFNKHAVSLLANKTSVEWLMSQPCRPLNIYDLAFDLMGRHAID